MKGKFIDNIIKINHVLFFLITCVVIIMFLIRFIPDILRESYSEPKVELSSAINDTSEQKDIQYRLTYLGLFKEIHVISIESDQIKLEQEQDSDSDMFNMFSGGGGNDLVRVNLMFIGPDNIKRKLFEQDVFIYSASIDDFKYIRSGDEVFVSDKNYYTVISSDSNKDGYLSPDDQKDFYISDYNGLNLQLAIENIHSYELINVDMVLIEQFKNGKQVFNMLDLTSNKITQLDVNLN